MTGLHKLLFDRRRRRAMKGKCREGKWVICGRYWNRMSCCRIIGADKLVIQMREDLVFKLRGFEKLSC
jgi:hypothetical protein